MTSDNDQDAAPGQPAPASPETPHEVQRNLPSVLLSNLAHVGQAVEDGLATAAAAFGAKKARDKLRKPPSGPGPGAGQDSSPSSQDGGSGAGDA